VCHVSLLATIRIHGIIFSITQIHPKEFTAMNQTTIKQPQDSSTNTFLGLIYALVASGFMWLAIFAVIKYFVN
jgi:hypothetical protein